MNITLLPGERWWGGAINDGTRMPFPEGFTRHLLDDTGNQVQTVLVSSAGRWVWSEAPFGFRLESDRLAISDAKAPVLVGGGGGDLRAACADACRRFFAPAGGIPDPLLFTRPQYNTWIELTYHQAEEPILRYAEAIVANGYPTGVLMIDDTWQAGYGQWRFDPTRFRDPRGMVARLHDLGFKVMLWVCPFISPDTPEFRAARKDGLLLQDVHGQIAIRPWWNGFSAVLDCTNPAALAWMHERLAGLRDGYGIDGFKFDAGDLSFYRADDRAVVPGLPTAHCQAWARVGLGWPLNEYRACFGLAGQPLAQRLKDKLHTWDERGLASCIPNALAQGLVGYWYCCPDMIGGGEYYHFTENADRLDHELVVRYAQASALFPMMQFSAAPWRVLPPAEAAHCLAMAKLHAEVGEEVLALAQRAAATGEPIMRHLAWAFPDQGYEEVRDQFLLGDGWLVAPVLEKDQRRRSVRFPPGRWLGDDGALVEGPCVREVDAPLGRLPRWRRQ